MFSILCFIIGTIIGSFLFLVGERIPLNQSILYPASHCPNCQKKLLLLDLIPVFSYLLLKKKCRYCENSIPPLSIFTELFCGILGCLLFSIYHKGNLSLTIFLLLIMTILLSITDLLYFLVEPSILYLFSLLAFISTIFLDKEPIYFIAPLTIFLLLSLLDWLLPNSLGGGDIKLLSILTFFLGWRTILIILFLASLFAILAFFLSYFIGKTITKLPFVPFLCIGLILVSCFPHLFSL